MVPTNDTMKKNDQLPSFDLPKEEGVTKSESLENENTRQVIGNSLNAVTGLINENIVVARYGTMASITLLAMYGISRTPFFFRYKRVSDIPSSSFANRRKVHGRIVGIVENEMPSSLTVEGGKDYPIICLVRQLSPIGRLLNRSSFEFMVGMSPSSQVHKGKVQDAKDLLKVEIAGIKTPPFYYAPPGKEGANDWLKSLAANRAPVTCTLLSRRVLKPTSESSLQRKKNLIDREKTEIDVVDPEMQQRAVCKLEYRPGMKFFRKDLGSSLVTFGRANVASGVHVEDPSLLTTCIDGSTSLKDIEGDVKYLQELEKYEFEAVKEKKGMWSMDQIRDSRPDLVEEANFEKNAGLWNRLVRRIRKG